MGIALKHLAQREGPYGMDRADIILLAKDEAGDTVALAAFPTARLGNFMFNGRLIQDFNCLLGLGVAQRGR